MKYTEIRLVCVTVFGCICVICLCMLKGCQYDNDTIRSYIAGGYEQKFVNGFRVWQKNEPK
jgi:hypothetical protein